MKKIIALLLVFTLVLSVSLTAFASFPDLQESSWDWARDEIDEMTSTGIIAGYTDGRFGPADGVTKLQSLLLMARILGYNNDEMKNIISLADDMYGDRVSIYNVSNPSEVAYLMYFGIISEDELGDYLSNANEVLKRYEAAILLTKVAGAEAEVKANGGATLRYADTPQIPSNARKYVKYVNDKGYMVGMTDTTFEPDTLVSRAQMAVMLYRIIKDLDITYVSGNFVSVSGSSLTLAQGDDQNIFNVPTYKARIMSDGKETKMESLPLNGFTVVTKFGDTVRFVDAVSPKIEETVTGTVTSLAAGTKNKITLKPFGKDETQSITLDSAVVITYLGKKASFSSITKGDTVTIDVEDGLGKTVVIANRSEVISGAKFVSVSYEPYTTITFTTNSGEKMTKAVAANVSIARNNNRNTELRDILSGDKLIITLENDIAQQIKVTSANAELVGTIEEIHISSNPYIVLRAEGESEQYAVANDVEVTLDKTPGTIYDLRIGSYVTANLESSTVKKIETTSNTTSKTIVGTVETINTDYNFFYMNCTNATTGESERLQVFVKKNGATKYIDSADGSTTSLGKMKEGCSVIITGTAQLDGSYVASAVVVMAPAA